MDKANKFSLAVCLTTFCLCLVLFSFITKNTYPQDKASVPALIEALKDLNKDVRKLSEI